MINGKTFYQVLGVLNTAEDLVIRAAYRSLSNKYHPDKWAGDKQVSHERMVEINAAYEVLGDAAKRRQYDEELKRQGKFDDAADIDNDTSDFEGIYTEHSDAWDIALKFFPDLNELHEQLRKVNSSLAYTFKTTLLEKKNYAQGADIAWQMEHAFLVKYFGKNASILALAKSLITNNARSAARELNRIVNVMGNSVTASQVKEVLREQYPNAFGDDVAPSSSLKELLRLAKDRELSEAQEMQLLEIVGVRKVLKESHWWHGYVYRFTWIDGNEKRICGYQDMANFIYSHVLPLYKK